MSIVNDEFLHKSAFLLKQHFPEIFLITDSSARTIVARAVHPFAKTFCCLKTMSELKFFKLIYSRRNEFTFNELKVFALIYYVHEEVTDAHEFLANCEYLNTAKLSRFLTTKHGSSNMYLQIVSLFNDFSMTKFSFFKSLLIFTFFYHNRIKKCLRDNVTFCTVFGVKFCALCGFIIHKRRAFPLRRCEYIISCK